MLATERADGQPRASEWWLLALLFGLACVAFAPTVSYDFVSNDEWQIARNPWIRDWSYLGRLFTTHVWGLSDSGGIPTYYRPLHMLTYALVYRMTGLRPEGLYLADILLHGACTVLVTVLGLRLTADRAASVAGGALFALHPAHSEAVAWIAGLPEPLCAAFFLRAPCVHVCVGSARD